MKKVLWLILLVVGMMGVMSQAAEPVARVTSDVIAMAAAATNGTDEVWLNTGEDELKTTERGVVKTGAGLVRAVMYNAAGPVTNGVITFYTYDAGVKKAFYTVSGVTSNLPSGRHDLLSTNLVYCGRIRVEVAQDSFPSNTCAWSWAAIVE